MSRTALRNCKNRSAIAARHDATEADQEIRDYLNGCYDLRPWEITEDDVERLFGRPNERVTYDHDALMKQLATEGKSAGARYIAARLNSGAGRDLAQLAKDYWCHRAIKRELSLDELREIGASVSDLRMLGIRFGWEARRFYSLYREVRVSDRPWGSCYQVNHQKVLAMATTPNYNRLPLWVKKGLIEHDPYIQTVRVGNIWRLLDCVRAWKWCSALPKSIAEKVGRMSLRGRVLAALAWLESKSFDTLYHSRERGWLKPVWSEENGDYDEVFTPRSEIVESFWMAFRKLEKQPLLALLPKIIDRWYNESGTVRCIVEGWLGLPHQSLNDKWPRNLYDSDAEAKIIELIATYGNPKDACQHLFACNGKATVRAFQQCQSKDTWRWAGALAEGNADAVQKILKMDSVIAWQPDAVDFLLSLPTVSRLRMLQATEFKYRGEICPISEDHVRDTGYLWSNIQNKPELGRVRCWFSVHETLAAAFVKELPDEALPIPIGWERVDGLASVDGCWELEFPKHVATLKYYGQILNNCVGGYGPAIKSGRSVVFVVREYGQITHCVEFSGNRCNQFYQTGNSSPDYSLKESVLNALEQAGLA